MGKLKTAPKSDKAIMAAIRKNMVAMGFFNKPKIQVHKSKKAYDRRTFKRIDEL
jgi:hypothetical protein